MTQIRMCGCTCQGRIKLLYCIIYVLAHANYNFACSAFLLLHVHHALQKWSDQLRNSDIAVTQLTQIPEYYRNTGIPVKNTGIQRHRPASVAQLDAPSDWRPWGRGFNPRQGRQHSFVEIDHEIFSTVILPLPLIQEGQLSVSGERMCTILVNRLEDLACPVNVWLGKLTALDMTPLGWLGRKTSTQTNKDTNTGFK